MPNQGLVMWRFFVRFYTHENRGLLLPTRNDGIDNFIELGKTPGYNMWNRNNHRL